MDARKRLPSRDRASVVIPSRADGKPGLRYGSRRYAGSG